MARSYSYHVAPRYTPGSPALVDVTTAMRVADEEKAAYEWLVNNPGAMPEDDAKAKKLGLKGIVEARDGLKVLDVLTQERFWRGRVKAWKVERDDVIVRIESYGVPYYSRTEQTPTLPRKTQSVSKVGNHVTINLETEGEYPDRFYCLKGAEFTIERNEKAK